jgi:uracil-DNA glycosylase family 4
MKHQQKLFDIFPVGNPGCTLCSLHQTAQSVCLMGQGPKKCEVMIVGEAPGFREDDIGKPFQGKSGQLLEKIMNECGVKREDVYISNAVKCRPPENRTPSAKEVKTCKPYLMGEIERVKPKFVILLGAVALKSVLGKAKITQVHGTTIVKDGITYMPTFHPAAALRDPKRMQPIKMDLENFFNITKGIIVESPHKLNNTIVNNMELLRECIDSIRRSKIISFDLETTGLDRFEEGGKINLLNLGTPSKQYIIPLQLKTKVWLEFSGQLRLISLLAKILKGKKVIGHFGKFDNLWLQKIYGVKFPMTFDTGLASHLLDENSLHDLEYLSRIKLDAPVYDIPLDVKQGLVPERIPELMEYAAWDAYYTMKLFFLFSKQLKEDECLNKLFYTMVMPAARAYEVVEDNGVFIHIDKLNEVKKYLGKQIKITERALNSFLPKNYGEVNWGSADQVRAVLFDELHLEPAGFTPKGLESTAEDFLKRMLQQHEIIKHILDHRGFSKLQSSFVEGWEKRMKDGCWLHPSFKVHGTVTGRPSCVNPNMQQVPRDKQIRQLVGAPDGWIFFEADYSQIELRIAALIADEPTMLAIFNNDGDIHLATASAVSGIPEDQLTEEERKKAKAVNFGFIYGMGWRKFMDYALDKYGVRLIERESKAFRKRFFEKYNRLPEWHDRQKKIVHLLGQVRTLTGRIRHLPEIYSPEKDLMAQAERNAINSPVQGFAAELVLMALPQIQEEFSVDQVQVCGTVHDAIIGRVKIGKNKEHLKILKRIRDIMEHPNILDELEIQLDIPIKVDVKIGNWGLGQKVQW